MFTSPSLNAVIHVINKAAVEQYFRQEGITAKPLPDLVPIDADVPAVVWGGIRDAVRLARRVIEACRPVERRAATAAQGVVAK